MCAPNLQDETDGFVSIKKRINSNNIRGESGRLFPDDAAFQYLQVIRIVQVSE